MTDFTMSIEKNGKRYDLTFDKDMLWLSNEEGEGMGLEGEVKELFKEKLFDATDSFYKENF